IDKPSEDDLGLFGVVSSTTDETIRFKNIKLLNIDYTGNNYVGGLIGSASKYGDGYSFKIHNVNVTGTISCYSHSGGVVASNPTWRRIVYYRCITNINITASRYTSTYAGGIVGGDTNAIFIECSSSGSIINSANNLKGAGGILGTGPVYEIIRCVSRMQLLNADLTYPVTEVGNLVGRTSETPQAITVYDSYSKGKATVGLIYKVNIDYDINLTRCYTSANALASIIGEKLGTGDCVCTNVYWDQEITTNAYITTVPTGTYTGKTTAEMKQQSTYEGWDFDTVWAIDPNKNGGYPYLRWEEEEGLIE
ncbi:MAG: hypothetical protein ACP5E3_00170, partial [Bacteroidales bacterium]